MTEDEAIQKFADMTFAHAGMRLSELSSKGTKMAHYTTAEKATLILKNQSLWLRNAAMMNDFSEVTYGSACLDFALRSGLGARLETALNNAHPGLWQAVAEWLNRMDHQTRNHTYLTSLSAHDPDDLLGRLSMWRAYGGPTSGVAIIFNVEPFYRDSDRLGAYSSPVLYGDQFDFTREFEIVVKNIEGSPDLLKTIPFDNAKSILFNALQYATLSTKHPAFAEEKEWRIIHSPLTDATAFIPTSIQTIGGLPQMICEIPLRDQPGLEMPWLSLDSLINRIIIGPCVYPQQVAFAFHELLLQLGVTEPGSRISIANIPLRQLG